MTNRDLALYGNDLLIQNGDLCIGESDAQHITDTLNAFPGWWKQYPADGVGVFAFYNSTASEQALKRKIAIQLQSDGYTVSNPQVTISADGKLTINPNATP